jgi:hypothetical protein
MVIEPLRDLPALLLAEVAERGEGSGRAIKTRLLARRIRWRSTADVDERLGWLVRRGLLRNQDSVYSITCLGWATLAVLRGQILPMMAKVPEDRP